MGYSFSDNKGRITSRCWGQIHRYVNISYDELQKRHTIRET